MGFFTKIRDKFLGMDKPLGNNHKQNSQDKTEQAQIDTQDKLQSVLIRKNVGDTPPIVTEEQPHKQSTSQSNQSNTLHLDVLDLSRVIDIYAESQAVQAFDQEMSDRKGSGFFSKIGGFFKRSFQRMGRDAWIDTKKREYINNVKEGLKNGTYTESFLREHVASGDQAIVHDAHLVHEEVQKEEKLPQMIQSAVDAWMATPAGSSARTEKTKELKATIEATYPTVTADLTQLEQSLIRLERAKISSEIETLDAKLNILDIGRIEQGNGKRKEGWFVQMADRISNSVNNSGLPDWVKQKVVGLVRHPNTAAIATAMITRAGIGALAGTAAAAGFMGGFLVPVAIGSAAGGFFAGVRARREMRDRTAEIDRRGAEGYETGNRSVDGESSNTAHQSNTWQHPVMDLYTRLANAEQNREDALVAGIYYLVKHRVGREQGLNMLQYDADKSISRQHVEMIRLMNEKFPGLVASFNDGSLFDDTNTSHESTLAKAQYEEIQSLAARTMGNRAKEEGKYALKQGAIFGGVAFGVGSTVGIAVHGLLSGTNGYWQTTPGSGTSQYPGGLQGHTNVHRGFWYDNGTPAPKFDHTELMIHADKSGGWNVSHMIGKTSTSSLHHSHGVNSVDFTSGKIQALITPKKGGPSFLLPIDAKGNIQIPASMQQAFNTRSFAFLEVGEVSNTTGAININPIATVVGKGNMIFDMMQGPDEEIWIAGTDAPWGGIPVGANKYHELGDRKAKSPVHGFIDPTPPEEENIGDIPTPPPISVPRAPLDEQGEGEPPEDPTGLWEDDDGKQDELTKARRELDDLWKKIVEIRDRLEKRRQGEIALSDSEVAELENMVSEKPREGTTSILVEYWKRRGDWNTKIEEIEKKPPLEATEGQMYQDRIRSLIESGLLATQNGKPLIYHFYGRTIVAIKTRNGGIIPFYRSAHGTSGKKASNWYPCFGITDDEGWIIKGDLKGMSIGYGVKELKTIQDTLNRNLNWNPELDRDFAWNKARHPFVQAGSIITDFTKEEEKKQESKKPTGSEDPLASAWIVEWINRVTHTNQSTRKSEEVPPTQGEDATSRGEGASDISRNTPPTNNTNEQVMEESFEAAQRVLGASPSKIDERIRGWIEVAGATNNPDFVLQGENHRQELNRLFGEMRSNGGVNAMKAVNAYYAKGGKVWLSNMTSIGFSNNYAIAIGLQNGGAVDDYTRSIYEIAGVRPMPSPSARVFAHELGHYITMAYHPETLDLIDEVEQLRDSQGVGLVPLSSLPFYDHQERNNPNGNVKFWEDMGELMGLYIMGGRNAVKHYLDDRINVRRKMKANISEGLRDRIMNILDSAYRHYTS